MKRLLAFILTIVMVLGVLPISGQTAQAAAGDKIDLGKIVWSKDKTTYRFPGVKASFANNQAQKLFCLSVSNGGSFVVADDFQFVGDNRTVKAIQKNGNKLEYITLIDHGGGTGIAGKELTSITVRGTDITNEQIQAFMRGLTFKRNGVAPQLQQEVSVIANETELQDDEIAMASGGKIHYYRHVKFNDEDKPIEQRATWYDAYAAAKKAEKNGLKGYLATITDENEEKYIYGAFGGGIQAWIGGARTHTEGITFDADTIPDDALNPGGIRVDGGNGGEVARNWYWMCGPEAGTPFYRTNTQGNAYWGTGDNAYGPVEGRYNDWNTGEPNNNVNLSDGRATYKAEYALEYGYQGANWNDYSPYNVTRQGYGMSGYIIEFSPYDLPDEEGKNPTHVEETSPSVTGVEVVWVKDGELSMTVKDFIIKESELGSLDDSVAKEKSEVTATDGDDEIGHTSDKITVDSQKLEEMKQKGKGEYELSFTYTNDEDASVTEAAKVTVVDELNAGRADDGSGADIVIGANNFDITLEQANAILDNPSGQTQLIKNLANAVATKNGEMVDPKDITIKECGIKPQKGTYPVTFEYKGTEVTVNATVYDNGSEKVTVTIVANDFTVQMGGSALSTDDFIIKSSATATASDGSAVNITLNASDMDALNHAIANGPLGDYKVRVAATSVNGAREETVVTVKVVQYPYIAEHDFIISVEDAKNATQDDIKDAADAKRMENDTDPGSSAPIVVPNGDVSKLNNVTEPGKIPDITLQDTTAGDKAEDRKVTATVVDETAKGKADNGSDQNADIVVGANHFSLTMKQAKAIKEDPTGETAQNILKTLANAVGTNNGKAVARKWIIGDGTKIEPAHGTYDVSFTYWGQTVTVKATVKDDGAADGKPVSKLPDTNLTANDFTIPAGSGDLTPDAFKENANAEAKDENGSTVGPITVNQDDLADLNKKIANGEKGVYEVKVTAGGETATVKVTVTDVGTVVTDNPNPEDNETIAGNNVTIDTKNFDDEIKKIIEKSNAHAYETDSKKELKVTADTSQVKNEPGTYDVILKTDKGTSVTIKVTVTKQPDGNPQNPQDPEKPNDPNDPYPDVVDESYMSGDDLNKRDDLPLLLAKGIGGDKKIALSWLKYKGAAGYEIYWSYCNGKKVYKKVTSTKKLKTTHKKLSYKKSYKYFVIAYKMVGNKKVYIAKSPQIHVAMKKDKRTNAKKVTVKKSKVTLKPGKTSKIKASMTRENKKKKLLQHAVKFRYYTDDYRVAKVDKKGKIKAVAPGKCNIYVIANNGVYKKVKVTVKK